MDQAALAAVAAELLAGLRDGCACGGRAGFGGQSGQHQARLHPAVLARLHDTLLRHAADILSGPDGLASFLRTRLTAGQFPAVSLPLDAGTPTSLITGSLRRAVTTRDRHCAFPGCHAHPPPARSTTSTPNPGAARRHWATWSCCAPSIT